MFLYTKSGFKIYVLSNGETRDHDAPYVIVNIRERRFEPRYKYIRDEKQFNSKAVTEIVATQALNLAYAMDDPEDKPHI